MQSRKTKFPIFEGFPLNGCPSIIGGKSFGVSTRSKQKEERASVDTDPWLADRSKW